jgi:preprotein translocase subunit SecG
MTVLIILAMVASGLLVLVVLAQNSKGGGLSSLAGGSGASNLIGVKKTADLLERLTWALAISIMVFSLAVNIVGPSTGSDEILNKVQNEKVGPKPTQDNSIQPLETKPADTTK